MNNCKIKGFSLLEMLLVLAIASSLVVLMLNYTTQKSDEMRRDRTVLQMQQILNASMSFYLNKAHWPLTDDINTSECGTSNWKDLTVSALRPNYIPDTLKNNPYAKPYKMNCNSDPNGGVFFAYTEVNTPANASVIAGRLPLAFITTPGSLNAPPPLTQPAECNAPPFGAQCTVVVASVNIPGQNLNNARSVNFAEIYYSGSCVPAPNCPPGMKANILVTPASVSGVNDPPTCGVGGCSSNVYPISSFTAFARGDVSGKPSNPESPGPLDCKIAVASAVPLPCLATPSTPITYDGTLYWRVCLTVTTQKKVVYPTSGDPQAIEHGKSMGNIVAITRCVPNDGEEKPAGSIDVWQPNVNYVP